MAVGHFVTPVGHFVTPGLWVCNFTTGCVGARNLPLHTRGYLVLEEERRFFEYICMGTWPETSVDYLTIISATNAEHKRISGCWHITSRESCHRRADKALAQFYEGGYLKRAEWNGFQSELGSAPGPVRRQPVGGQ